MKLVLFPFVMAIVYAVKQLLAHRFEPAKEPEITAQEHPPLWQEIRQLSEIAQSVPPERIVVDPEVNAGVSEHQGRRDMVLGLPLLATFERR